MSHFKKDKNEIVFILVFISIIIIVLFAALYSAGFFGGRIILKKGAYWPEFGYRMNSITMWKDGSIIYYEEFHAPKLQDSTNKAHIKLAEEFLK